MMSASRTAIITPAYNAARTLGSIYERIPAQAWAQIQRIFVVDDGSTDNTWAVIQQLAEKYDILQPLRHEVNRGYGGAEKTLLDAALADEAEIVVMLHADGQYSPEKILDLLNPFQHGDAGMVQGSRMLAGGALKGGMPFYKYIANKCLTAVENLVLGLRLAEYHSGYMLYHRRALEAIPYHQLSDSFDFDMEMIVMSRVLNLRLVEVAIPTIYADEVSYLNPVKYGLDILSVLWRYKRGDYHRLVGL